MCKKFFISLEEKVLSLSTCVLENWKCTSASGKISINCQNENKECRFNVLRNMRNTSHSHSFSHKTYLYIKETILLISMVYIKGK